MTFTVQALLFVLNGCRNRRLGTEEIWNASLSLKSTDSFPRSIKHSTSYFQCLFNGQLPTLFGFQRTLSVLLYLQFCICNLRRPEKDTKLVSIVFMQDQCFHNYRKLQTTYNTKEEGY